MDLSRENLAYYLVRRRLITTEAVVDGDLTIIEDHRRNKNFRIRSRRGGLFVKQLRLHDPKLVAELTREATCYWTVANEPSLAGLRPLVPGYRDYDVANHVLVTEYYDDHTSLQIHRHQAKSYPPGSCATIGAILAKVHDRRLPEVMERAMNASALSESSPWVLRIFRDGRLPFDVPSDGIRRYFDSLRSIPDLATHFERLLRGWEATTLIHGDVKWDNFIFSGGDGGAPSIKLIDWELAGLGDPAWDLACALSAFYTARFIEVASSPAPVDFAGLDVTPDRPELEALWSGYLRERGVDQEEQRPLMERAMAYYGARLLQTGFEYLWSSASVPPVIDRLVQQSLGILRQAEALASPVERGEA